jgi:signal transduction histidine kinase
MSEHGNPGVWYANRLGPIWRGDQIENAILIATDITQRKYAEEQVRREQQSLRQLLDLQERERRLIAYDIHDGLVQYLTGALMHLEAFAASNALGNSPADYERGTELLREALAEGRRLISGLRPPILDERGVVAALEYLVSEIRPDIPLIEFQNHTHFGRLAPAIEVAIFRIAQEALTNVRLHSGAERAQVELVQHGEWVRLVVRDWGRGFDPATVQEERFGLQGIRQRARLLGASAAVESAPGQGTVLTVDFPLIQEKPMATGEHSPSAQH